jgi:predicted RNA-binding protein YlxR (DUF448 family)
MVASIRTCIGCRQRDAAAEMVRLWLRPDLGSSEVGEVVVDGPRTGRGVSLHARPGCLETGLRPDVLSRAFKRHVTVRDAAELVQRITIASRRKR